MNDMEKSVCVICPSLYPLLDKSIDLKLAGGAEAQLKTIGTLLQTKGHKVDFIVDDFGQKTIQKFDGITVHKVPFKYLGGSNLNIISSWIALLWTLYRIKADFHLLKLPRHLVFPIGWFCRIFRKKFLFIGQIDTDVDLEFIRKSENSLSFFFYKAGMKLVNYTIAQNEIQRDGFVRVFGKKSAVIKNILTLPPADNIQKDNSILWVGNSSTKKQPELFVELAQKLPQYQFKMIMSQSQERQDDSFIRDQVACLSNFDYVGFVPFRKIMPYYQRAGLFVSTSLREGFPNTFLQSWQFRTPVVSLGIDPDGVISRYDLGIVCYDIEELSEKISLIMDDRKLREKMGGNALTYVENFHSKEVVYTQYKRIFD